MFGLVVLNHLGLQNTPVLCSSPHRCSFLTGTYQSEVGYCSTHCAGDGVWVQFLLRWSCQSSGCSRKSPRHTLLWPGKLPCSEEQRGSCFSRTITGLIHRLTSVHTCLLGVSRWNSSSRTGLETTGAWRRRPREGTTHAPHGRACHGMTCHGWARHRRAWHRRACHGRTRHRRTRHLHCWLAHHRHVS